MRGDLTPPEPACGRLTPTGTTLALGGTTSVAFPHGRPRGRRARRWARPAGWLGACLLALIAPLAQAQALWLDDAGRPRPAAHQAVRWLTDAASHGLLPQDYDAAGLAQAVRQADAQPLPSEATAPFDAALTSHVLDYLRDLRHGRVDATQQLGAHYNSATAPAPDLTAALRDAVSRGQPDDAQRAAWPPWPPYVDLHKALGRYRALGDHPAWQARLPALPGGRLQAGQAWAGVPTLAARLQALGDLPAPATTTGTYTAALQKAVQSFQARHGLTVDGVLNKPTLDALAVPPAARARQIALAMERLRLTPLPEAVRFVTVNVPEFMLRALRHEAGSVQQDLQMRVIVGKALDTRTPLFDEDMRWIEFSPYWNIPPSIARKETVPRLRASPGYLAVQGMEFVSAGGQVSTAVTPAQLDAVMAGSARIRQRPGPRNALGDIKFMLPNNQNIYLHHTPSPGLFNRTRRDFSHGCVRIEEPVALALWVLHDQPEWTEARVRQSMGRPRPVIARLTEPVPVLLLYQTAVADGDTVHFVPDLYGQDALLERALQQPRTPRPAAAANESASPPALHTRAGAAEKIAAESTH